MPGGLILALELLARMPAAVAYLAGPELVFEFANDNYRLLVGAREVLGLPVRKALPEVAGQGYFEMLDRVMASGEPVRAHEAEVWVRRGGEQAEQLFVDFVYQPVRDDSGSLAGVLVHATDVSAHVRAQRELKALSTELAATQERYRALFETMPQGVVHHAADGAVLGANPAASQILGLSLEALPIRHSEDPSW
jgi:PAS domain-containing protein